MPRVKRGVGHVKRRKNLLKKVKGFKWGRKNLPKLAKTAAVKAGVHAYVDRRLKKRVNRGLWQIRIGAAVREHGLSYSRFMSACRVAKVSLDRKILSTLAAKNPTVFAKIVSQVKGK